MCDYKSRVAALEAQIAKMQLAAGHKSKRTDPSFDGESFAPCSISPKPITDDDLKTKYRNTKAFSLVRPGDRGQNIPWFDSRFNEDRWLTKQPDMEFSGKVFTCIIEAEFQNSWPYDQREELHKFYLRHDNATQCTLGEKCDPSHWDLCKGESMPVAARDLNIVDLQLVCMKNEDADKGMFDFYKSDFESGAALERCSTYRPDDVPCKLFNMLGPLDLSFMKNLGYTVLMCRVVEDGSSLDFGEREKWMDAYGRTIRCYMYSIMSNALEALCPQIPAKDIRPFAERQSGKGGAMLFG
ncbi:hypothetical protein F53441_5413 [Fusarium austroafricanum]|uniref:Uncharacterized protein n=1 Tax=Fusarium austroafricanum TaxID=2364996 RepID=A0A8H4KLY5_9HYPO|nr:hypothetical protein F53441_5413 [Fusarium austroafricanum]